MGRLRRPFGNLSVIILKKKMGLRPILILQGFKILSTIIMHKCIIILGLLILFVLVCLGDRKEYFTTDSQTKFVDIQKTINPNIQFNMTEVENQVSQEDIDEFIKNGIWTWTTETQRLYKEALTANPYIKTEDQDTAMKKAQTIYNEKIILEILASQTPEGRFLLNGMDIMREIPDSGFGNYPYEAGLKEQLSTVRCYQGEDGNYSLADNDKKTIDYNKLESLVPGFKFINGACDPCDALNQKYTCPFKVADKTSDVWKQMWGLGQTEFPILTGLKTELDEIMK